MQINCLNLLFVLLLGIIPCSKVRGIFDQPAFGPS